MCLMFTIGLTRIRYTFGIFPCDPGMEKKMDSNGVLLENKGRNWGYI